MGKVFSSVRRFPCKSNVCVPFRGSLCLCCIYTNATLPTSETLKDAFVLWFLFLWMNPSIPDPQLTLEMWTKDHSGVFLPVLLWFFSERHMLLLPRLLCHEQSQWWTVSALRPNTQRRLIIHSRKALLSCSQRNTMLVAFWNKYHRKLFLASSHVELCNPHLVQNTKWTERNERNLVKLNHWDPSIKLEWSWTCKYCL